MAEEKKIISKIIQGHPNYTIYSDGTIKKNGIEVHKYIRKDCGVYSVLVDGKRYGLAKLVANHFIENKYDYRNVIFKDRNRLNVDADNLFFLDNSNYRTYCGLHNFKVTKKIGDRFAAANICQCEFLKKFYETLDES